MSPAAKASRSNSSQDDQLYLLMRAELTGVMETSTEEELAEFSSILLDFVARRAQDPDMEEQRQTALFTASIISDELLGRAVAQGRGE